jgi:hypothetical protein
MGDMESRRDDARIEVWLEKARRSGAVADCYICGREDRVKYGAYDDETVPLCRVCWKKHEAKY